MSLAFTELLSQTLRVHWHLLRESRRIQKEIAVCAYHSDPNVQEGADLCSKSVGALYDHHLALGGLELGIACARFPLEVVDRQLSASAADDVLPKVGRCMNGNIDTLRELEFQSPMIHPDFLGTLGAQAVLTRMLQLESTKNCPAQTHTNPPENRRKGYYTLCMCPLDTVHQLTQPAAADEPKISLAWQLDDRPLIEAELTTCHLPSAFTILNTFQGRPWCFFHSFQNWGHYSSQQTFAIWSTKRYD